MPRPRLFALSVGAYGSETICAGDRVDSERALEAGFAIGMTTRMSLRPAWVSRRMFNAFISLVAFASVTVVDLSSGANRRRRDLRGGCMLKRRWIYFDLHGVVAPSAQNRDLFPERTRASFWDYCTLKAVWRQTVLDDINLSFAKAKPPRCPFPVNHADDAV